MIEKKLAIINDAALHLLMPEDIQEIFRIIVTKAVELVDGSFGSIILHDNKEMVRVYTSDPNHFSNRVRKESSSYKAYSQRKIIVVPISEFASVHPELVERNIKSTIYIPLSNRNKTIGVLVIHSKNKIKLETSDESLLSLFGTMASLAIRKTQLYTETKTALETRDHFISHASHELRTPLTSINGYIQLLQSKMKDKNTVESKWVNELYDESKRLTNLIIELMEINRIKQGTLQFNLRENNLNEFFEELESQVKSISNREVIFENHYEKEYPVFIGDPDKLMKVFVGLVSNALKFSPANGPIIVTLNSSQSKFSLSVIDKGNGMSREQLAKVFEGFNKFDNQEGQGFRVGLLLAKHIIKFHHGTIEINSKINKGTKVEVKLPLLSYEAHSHQS
jgi:signal transduction histidine kinase